MFDPQKLSLPPLPEPLPEPVIDAHTHLDTTERYSKLPCRNALELAKAVQVCGIVQVGCDLDDSRWGVEFAAEHEAVVACVALHPNTVPEDLGILKEQLSELEALAVASQKVRGIGESGLDYYRKDFSAAKIAKPAWQQAQHYSFAAHIELAKQHNLALVIHDREAHDDIADILDVEGWPEKVMFHCFSGDLNFAERVLSENAYISFPGTLTFKSNTQLQQVARIVPDDKFLVETDAPYLTPAPNRGKPNSSYLLPDTLRFLAQLRAKDDSLTEIFRSRSAAIPLDDIAAVNPVLAELAKANLARICRLARINAETLFGGRWIK